MITLISSKTKANVLTLSWWKYHFCFSQDFKACFWCIAKANVESPPLRISAFLMFDINVNNSCKDKECDSFKLRVKIVLPEFKDH